MASYPISTTAYTSPNFSSTTNNVDEGKKSFLNAQKKIIFITVSIVLVLLGSVLNGLIIFLLRRNSHLLDIPANRILLNKAIIDFLTSFILLPYEMIAAVVGNYEGIRNIEFYLIFFTLNVGVHGAVIMSIDRLLAIIYPLRYYSFVTATRIRWILALNWLISFAVTVLLYTRHITSLVPTPNTCISL